MQVQEKEKEESEGGQPKEEQLATQTWKKGHIGTKIEEQE